MSHWAVGCRDDVRIYMSDVMCWLISGEWVTSRLLTEAVFVKAHGVCGAMRDCKYRDELPKC